MTAPVALVRNEGQDAHRWPGHPERPERVHAILDYIAAQPDLRALPWIPVGPANVALPRTVHTDAHIARVSAMSEQRGGWFDADTYCGAESYAVALQAASAAGSAVEAVAAGEVRHAFAVVRPPGHHATADVAMGFCLFNNAAIAVRAAQARGLRRVAVIDIDVHHGNGTQDIFAADGDVLYCSLHQFPFYPGTGSAEERGEGDAAGTTVNVPLAAGTDGDRWLHLFDTVIAPAVDRFAPDVLVVSAGFDAHARDPLAGLRLTEAAYAAAASRIRALSERHCSGRSVWLLEGGYDLGALGESAGACLRALGGAG